MPTKAQAKTAIDNARTLMFAEIDLLPAGTNIQDGRIDFNPTKGYIKQLAPDEATADSWRTTMQTNITGAGRTYTSRKEKHEVEGGDIDRTITINAPPFIHQIVF